MFLSDRDRAVLTYPPWWDAGLAVTVSDYRAAPEKYPGLWLVECGTRIRVNAADEVLVGYESSTGPYGVIVDGLLKGREVSLCRISRGAGMAREPGFLAPIQTCSSEPKSRIP